MQHLTVHIALDDQTEENGAIKYIPGSHFWHRVKDGKQVPLPITDIDFKDMDSVKTILTPEENENFKPIPGLLKKGYASFHHPLMVHGSFPNRTAFPRRAAVLNYFAEGTRSNSDKPLLQGVPVIPPGEPLTCRFFPLVFDPKWME
jgi:ectoine hydroxylase-related dioxygenase (phytanoyl-CoA dioxygenase family)